MNNYDRHLAAILAAAFIGIAAQPSNAAIPTSAAVAARIDLAKARSLPASSAAIDCLFATVPELGRGGGLLAQNFGIDPRRDISSIEAWADGFTYDGESLALLDASTLARGKFDEARMASSVRSSRGFRRALAGDREIMTADFARPLDRIPRVRHDACVLQPGRRGKGHRRIVARGRRRRAIDLP